MKNHLFLKELIIKLIIPKILLFVFHLLLLGAFSSCIVVVEKEPENIEVSPPQYAPKSGIDLSGDPIFTKAGDMGLQVPSDWVADIPPQEFQRIESFNSNPESSLLLVVSNEGKYSDDLDDIEKDDLQELIEMAVKHRGQNSQSVRTGKIEFLKIQERMFTLYRMSHTGGAIESRNALIVSPSGNIYNIALLPVNDIMNKMPPEEEIDRIFKDILYTVMM